MKTELLVDRCIVHLATKTAVVLFASVVTCLEITKLQRTYQVPYTKRHPGYPYSHTRARKGDTLSPITRVLASITRLANTRHRYEWPLTLAGYLGLEYPGTRRIYHLENPGMEAYHLVKPRSRDSTDFAQQLKYTSQNCCLSLTNTLASTYATATQQFSSWRSTSNESEGNNS